MNFGDRLGIVGLSLGAFSTTCDIIKAISVSLEVWHRVQSIDQDVDYFRAQIILQKDILDSWYADWFGFMGSGRTSAGKVRMLRAHQATIESTMRRVRSDLAQLDPIKLLESSSTDPRVWEQTKWIASQRQAADAVLQRVESLLRGLYLIMPLQAPDPEAQVVVSLFDTTTAGTNRLVNELKQSGDGHAMLHKFQSFQQLRQQLDHDLETRVEEFQHKLNSTSAKIESIPNLVPEDETSGSRSRVKTESCELLVEWKEYRLCHGQDAIRIDGRCENLARMLSSDDRPPELSTLKCEGFFDDTTNKRFGFVFRSPAIAGEELVSLNRLLQQKSGLELPTLEQRYHMTYALGLSLSIIFAVGWLHKGIRSHNVLFLRRGHDVQWSRPYLVGFAYSREDHQDALSEKLESSERFNLYRHPDKLKNAAMPYRQEFDVYSLGVLMFEIAAWHSTFSLWTRGHDAASFRRELCNSESRKLIAHRMGTDYCDAMQKCLDGTISNCGTSVAKAFFTQVVEMLRRQTLF